MGEETSPVPKVRGKNVANVVKFRMRGRHREARQKKSIDLKENRMRKERGEAGFPMRSVLPPFMPEGGTKPDFEIALRTGVVGPSRRSRSDAAFRKYGPATFEKKTL